MKNIWAPWRIGYIKKVKNKKCIFCEMIKEKKDAKHLIIKRDKYCFSALNVYPYNNGHIMVVPYRHKSDLKHLKSEEFSSIFKLLKETELKLNKEIKPDGYNIGVNIGKAAGAGVDGHMHFHIVPRWSGGTNFMPVCADTKIISQSLQELFEVLKND